MFNLFPLKKSVNKILEDNGLSPLPNLVWDEPVETKETIKLKEEIKKWQQDWDQQNKNIIDLIKEVKSLRHLKQENADLMELLAKYRDGYQGSCYACEPVGELNQKLELRLTAYQKMVEGAYKTIEKLKKENFDLKTKHPMHPLQWGDISNALQRAKDLTKGVEVDLNKSLDEQCDKEEEPAFFNCACGDCYEKTKKYNQFQECDITGHKIPKEKSWEEAAGDLALRVAKLEEHIKHVPKITFKNDHQTEDNNPLYKHY